MSFTNIIQDILNNLFNFCWAILILVCSYASNIVFSLYYNIEQNNESFDVEKLKKGIIKLLFMSLGLIFIIVAITTIPIFSTYIGWTIPEEYTNVLSNTLILSACLYVSCKYLVESISKFYKIINYNNNNNNQ